ncbi:unnamed protein product [Arctia plantaginis]|uniref:PiggyBac transposable element-derived protein domain-containing protein n=1 Tax=Arctia plantaginis TaxID=874455 RepID=A0A8S1B178_ARCPL|nr:unnamed protein product [Arctia plantaginis]
MTDKPGPSKRRVSVLTSGSRAKKGRSFSADSSLDDFECSSEEALFSQSCDEEDESDEEEVSDDSLDSIFDIRCRVIHKRMDRFQSPSHQKTLKPVPEKTFTRPMSPDRHMATSPSIIQDYGEVPDIPDNLLNTSVTPSVSMLMSDVTSINFPSEDIKNLPLRSPLIVTSPTASLSQTRTVRLDDQPSPEGATSFSWQFTKTQELLVPSPSDPFEAFRLLLNDNILDLIVRETNANAIRVLKAPGVKQHSRIMSWKDMTRTELLTFLGLVLHTGTIRLNRLGDYWKKHWLFNIPCFEEYMSRNRFMLILRCLHVSSEANEEDRLSKIRPIVDHFNNRMNDIYYPGKQLSLDESMVLWRLRLRLGNKLKISAISME